jgi:exopolyphosphatase/pppGpp-phosphohydrolase
MRNVLLSPRHALLLLGALALCPVQARAALHGGVEIGSTGVKAIVLDVTQGPNGLRAKRLGGGTFNTSLSEGIAKDGTFDPKALAATAAAVKKYVEEIEGKHKVPNENIYVVGSSGIFSAIEKDEKAVKARQDELAQAIKKATGRTMDFITVQRESELSIIGIVPRAYQNVSLLIDIGGGNTKGGYLDGTKKYVTFGVPYGTKTFTVAAEKRSKDPVKGTALAAAEALRPALRSQVKEHPALAGRERVYLSGGACWALANFAKPTDRSGYAALTAKDIDAYRGMLLSKPGEYPTVDLSSLSKKDRADAEKDLTQIKKNFTPAQLLAGAEILASLASEMKLEGKKMYFARNGQFGWILAYAAMKSKTP